MGKIGDLWVRLGLKSDDYKRGMNAAKKQTSSFAGGLDKMKAGALAVWAAVGAAVTKFAKDFISATNTINDKWEATMSGIRASYQSVLADMATYKPDFSSFRNFFKNEWDWIKKTFGNAKEAGDAAQEMTKAFDAEFELVNSVKLQKAMIQEELNDLYVKMRDTTLSPADRQAAAERYKALLQPLADAEVRIYGQMMEAASKAWQAGAGLSREYSSAEIKDFFANYGVNPEATKAKYGELASVYENRKGDEQNRVIYDILTRWEQANAQMSDVNKVLSRTTNSIKKELQTFDLNLAEDLEGGLQDVNAHIDALDLALDKEIQGPTIDLPNLYEGLSDIDKAVAQSYMDALMDADFEFPEIDLSAFDRAEAELDQFVEDWSAKQQEIAQLNETLSQDIAESLGGGLQAFTDMLFGLEGADAKGILAALMQPFADTAGQLGGMLIAQGVAVEAFKTSLESLQGGVAIAAGAALLAVSAAMRSGIKALAKGNTGAGSAVNSGSPYKSTTDAINYDSTLTVYVEGRISGSDIIIAGSNQQKKWNR